MCSCRFLRCDGENDLGIGDLGALREFIDWIAEIGFTLVQLLPINETGADNSPYNAISAIAIEPTTLHLAPGSPEDLTRNDFADSLSETDLVGLRRGRVRYRQVKELKQRIFEKAFANFSARADEKRQSEFERFCQDESSWLRDYALFRVLIEQNNGSAAWDQWPQQHQTIESARNWLRELPLEKQSAVTRRLDFFCYVQWIAQQQWRDVKAHAEQRGVALMGDIPFGVSYYSADVFSRPDEFLLDWFGGAPPEPHFKDDAFTQKWGQNWGIPLYRWSAMRANNFQWWRERVRRVPDGSFTCSGSITSRDFTASMPFPGGPKGIKNSYHSINTRCWSELADARRISFHGMTTHPNTAKRTSATAKNTCALSWTKPAPRVWRGKILVWFPITCGPVCNRLASRDSKFRNGKPAMEWSFPGKCTSGCPLRRTRHTITNRFELYGNSYLSIKTPIRSDKRALH